MNHKDIRNARSLTAATLLRGMTDGKYGQGERHAAYRAFHKDALSGDVSLHRALWMMQSLAAVFVAGAGPVIAPRDRLEFIIRILASVKTVVGNPLDTPDAETTLDAIVANDTRAVNVNSGECAAAYITSFTDWGPLMGAVGGGSVTLRRVIDCVAAVTMARFTAHGKPYESSYPVDLVSAFVFGDPWVDRTPAWAQVMTGTIYLYLLRGLAERSPDALKTHHPIMCESVLMVASWGEKAGWPALGRMLQHIHDAELLNTERGSHQNEMFQLLRTPTATRAVRHYSTLMRDRVERIKLYLRLLGGDDADAFNMAVKLCPDLFRRSYPRRYVAHDGWRSSKHLHCATAIFHLAFHDADVAAGSAGAQVHLSQPNADAHNRLLDLGVPTYFVSKALSEELNHTDPPTDITLSDLNTPVDAFVAVIPDDTFDPQAPLLAFVNTASGLFIYDHRLRFCTVVGHNEPLCDALKSVGDWRDIASYAINLYVSMASEPDWYDVDPDVPAAAPVKASDGVGRRTAARDAWHPNFFGRRFVRAVGPGEAGDGSHASPRIHYRRGHWKSTHPLADGVPGHADVGKRVRLVDDQRKAMRLRAISDDGLFAELEHAITGEVTHAVQVSDLRRAAVRPVWIKPTQVHPKLKGES